MPSEATSILPYSIGLAISCLIVIALAERIIRTMPWLASCWLRAKDCINLEDSFPTARARNWICVGLSFPLVVISSWCSLYPPIALLTDNPWASMGYYILLYCAYFLLRWVCTLIFHGRNQDKRNFKYCVNISLSFYATFLVLAITSAAVAALCGASPELTRSIILWEAGLCYFMNLLRTLQIFAYYKGYLRAFSYLCTLEILPTAILIVPAVIL